MCKSIVSKLEAAIAKAEKTLAITSKEIDEGHFNAQIRQELENNEIYDAAYLSGLMTALKIAKRENSNA